MSKMTKDERIAAVKEKIASYPDFPKKGIIFRDLLPVLRYPNLFADVTSLFIEHLEKKGIQPEGIVALDARGFIFGSVLAQSLNIPFIPVRKPGKLPGNVIKEHFDLEYGSNAFEIQTEGIKQGMKIVIVDDMLATGGSMQATVKLVERCGGIVVQCLSVMELTDLEGTKKVTAPVYSLVQY